jgi:hypothetical protein
MAMRLDQLIGQIVADNPSSLLFVSSIIPLVDANQNQKERLRQGGNTQIRDQHGLTVAGDHLAHPALVAPKPGSGQGPFSRDNFGKIWKKSGKGLHQVGRLLLYIGRAAGAWKGNPFQQLKEGSRPFFKKKL